MPLASYRAALSSPGAARFVVAGYIANLTLAMQTLGALLLVGTVTRSFALGGAVAAVFGTAEAIGGPVLGRLADRYGQYRIITRSLISHVGGFVALIWLVSAHAPTWTYFAATLVAGLTSPPFGSMVRGRWAALLGDGETLNTAYALASTLDETIYIVGPPVVVLLAARVAASAGLWCTLFLVSAGGLALATQRSTEPPHGPPASRTEGGLLRIGGVWVITGTYLAFGVYVGVMDPAMVAFAQQHGANGFGGVLLALWTVGSVTAGIAFGMRTWRLPGRRLLLMVTAMMCALTVPMVFAGSIPIMIGCVILSGAGISPLLITGSRLLNAITPRAILTAGFSFTGAATGLGAAAGMAIGSDLIQQHGCRWALAFAVAMLFAAFLVSVGGQHVLAVPHASRHSGAHRPARHSRPEGRQEHELAEG